jgi:excisionase family DNA binding protein
MKQIKEKDFYTTSELAGVLKISKQSVLKRIHNESIRAQKMGLNFIIFKKDINIKKLIAEVKN